MKHIVWTRIDDRLIHGQVMTQWIQYTEANEVSDAGVRLKSINVGGIGAKAGRKPMFKNISVSEEEKEAFRNLLNKGINVFLRVIVTEPEEDIAKYL